MIIEGRPAKEIAEMAVSQGMRCLQQAALDMARQGETSLEEVYSLVRYSTAIIQIHLTRVR